MHSGSGSVLVEWAVAVLFMFVVFLGYLIGRRIEKNSTLRRDERLRSRPELSVEEIQARYYPLADPEPFREVWLEIAEGTGINPGIIRPDDRFSVELSARTNPLLDEFGALWELYDLRLKQQGLVPKSEYPKSVDEYVRTFVSFLPKRSDQMDKQGNCEGPRW